MKSKLLNDNGQKTFAVILEDGDEAIECLTSFAEEQAINSAQFTAIGAFRETTVGFYDFTVKDYHKIEISEQMEVLSITGDVSHYKSKIKLHAHAVLGKRDGTAHGGHLLKGIVHPTLEVIMIESPVWLQRKMDEASGIPLIKIDS